MSAYVTLPDTIDLALVAACEERIVNAWPAPATLMIEGWAVRFADGYSGRANSASPLKSGSTLSEGALALIERLYTEAGLPPCIRLTPLTHPGMARRLAARGYRLRDASIGMVAPLAAFEAAPASALTLEPCATRQWIGAVAARQSPDKNDPEKLAAIVRNIRLPAAFAALHAAGAPVALGMSVAERGMAEEGAPILIRLITAIASRFGIVVSEKVAAAAVPVVGALGGAAVNLIFMDHFQEMAHGHFAIRRLERIYGPDAVRAEYEAIRATLPKT